MKAEREVTVIVGDDHAIVREGIVAFLKPRMRANIVAHCSEGQEALREILDHAPDIAILDLHLPKIPVMELMPRVRGAGCNTRFIVLLTTPDCNIAGALLQAGASACLLKGGPASELTDAIAAALQGDVYRSQELLCLEQNPDPAAPDPAQVLSQREYEVFTRLAQGIRPRDIAKELVISAKTVDTYRANILKKLHVDGVAGLIRFALRHPGTSTSVKAN